MRTAVMKRILAFPLVRLVLIVVFFGALATPIALFIHPANNVWRSIAITWILTAFMLAAILVVERLTVGKTASAVGLNPRNALRDFILGAVLGAALFSTVILELTVAGFYRITAIHFGWDLAIAALLLSASAAFEELLFRGALFRLVQEWVGTWIALAVSAVVFGLAHVANPGATWVSTLAIALEAGILLGAAFVVTQNLWFPIGLHFAWNFFEGPVYGTQVSGRTFVSSAFGAHVSGPAIVTGGAFGPEAGLAAIVTCLLVTVALLVLASRRSLIVPIR